MNRCRVRETTTEGSAPRPSQDTRERGPLGLGGGSTHHPRSHTYTAFIRAQRVSCYLLSSSYSSCFVASLSVCLHCLLPAFQSSVAVPLALLQKCRLHRCRLSFCRLSRRRRRSCVFWIGFPASFFIRPSRTHTHTHLPPPSIGLHSSLRLSRSPVLPLSHSPFCVCPQHLRQRCRRRRRRRRRRHFVFCVSCACWLACVCACVCARSFVL